MKRHCLAAVALLLLWLPGAAVAQYCGAALNGNISFGSIDATQGARTLGQVNIWCNSATTRYVLVCVALGAPLDGSMTPRYLLGPNNARLAYNIYSDPTYTQVWGDGRSPTAPMVGVNVTMESWGGANTSTPYYASVPPQDAPAGHYWVNYDGGSTAVRVVGYDSGQPVCDPALPVIATFSFGVTADVTSTCALTATPINFGSVGMISSPINANGTVSVTCVPGAVYQVALDAGRGVGANTTDRLMTRGGGAETLTYRLYRDSARTQNWGNTPNVDTSTGTGTGQTQVLTVYGTLPAQTTGGTGIYSDTVTVTLTY